jgi:hypothetical protein
MHRIDSRLIDRSKRRLLPSLLALALACACACGGGQPPAKPRASYAIPSAGPSPSGSAAPRDPVAYFTAVERRVERDRKYVLSTTEETFEYSHHKDFVFDEQLELRRFHYEYSMGDSEGSRDYLFEHREFVCVRSSDSSSDARKQLIYCTRTGARVEEGPGDADGGDGSRAATPEEIAMVVQEARGMARELPDVGLQDDGTCSYSHTFEPVQLGESASFRPSSSASVPDELCGRDDALREAMQAVRFPGDEP